MEYTVKSGNPEKQRIGCVVIPVYASRKLSASAKIIDKEISRIIEEQYTRAIKLLEENKDKLTTLADRLLEKEVIFKYGKIQNMDGYGLILILQLKNLRIF